MTSTLATLVKALAIGLASIALLSSVPALAHAGYGEGEWGHEDMGTIVAKKVHITDNGDLEHISSFSFTLQKLDEGTYQNMDVYFFGSGGEVSITVPAGTYRLVEDDGVITTGYAISYENCEGIVVTDGSSSTCTITNDDLAPRLTLKKEVVGGDALAEAWTLIATNIADSVVALSGTDGVESDGEFQRGGYALSETEGPEGYTAGEWVCTYSPEPDGYTHQEGNVIYLESGDDVTCTITNTYGSTPPPVCGEGEHLEENVCVPDGETPTCPEGQHLEGEVCVPNDTGGGGEETPTCEPGFHLEGETCVADSTTGGGNGPSSDDMCTNIDGIQAEIPDDMDRDGTECFSEDEGKSKSRSSSRRTGGISRGGGEVLGASTCAPLITHYLHENEFHYDDEVVKLQEFLNHQIGAGLPVSGHFGTDTKAAVEQFQMLYWSSVLTPWFDRPDSGITAKDTPTGYVYQTTRWAINTLWCAGSEQFPKTLI